MSKPNWVVKSVDKTPAWGSEGWISLVRTDEDKSKFAKSHTNISVEQLRAIVQEIGIEGIMEFVGIDSVPELVGEEEVMEVVG